LHRADLSIGTVTSSQTRGPRRPLRVNRVSLAACRSLPVFPPQAAVEETNVIMTIKPLRREELGRRVFASRRKPTGSDAGESELGQTSRIHKPSALVSFGLPDPLSFRVRGHAMVAADRGDKPRQGKRQGQASKGPDPPSPGNAMSAKTTPQKAKRKNSMTGPPMQHRRYRWLRKT